MATLHSILFHSILFTSVLIGIAAFFYEVQGAPTETALRILDSSLLANSTDVTVEGSNRVKRQGGGGCGCGCGCCGCGGGGGGGCGCRRLPVGGGGCGCCCSAAALVPLAALVVVPGVARAAGHVADVVSELCMPYEKCSKTTEHSLGCGCCGCGGGGGGRKRRSLDNLRIRLGAKKLAELKGEEHSSAEYPRQKRDMSTRSTGITECLDM
ncbi:hypothetical protein OSTOST_16466 [Ostertagia ostertagi]